MGLDLVPEGKAKPGFEPEWRLLLERFFDGENLTDADKARFAEVVIPAYANVGAPRVGFDALANQWIAAKRGATSPEAIAACLRDFHGYYVLELAKAPGAPKYCNAEGRRDIDRTCFRGAFLKDCVGLVGQAFVDRAWGNMWPEEALAYGRELTTAADQWEAAGASAEDADALTGSPSTFEEQIDILRSAGAWYAFWGERGHPIRAYF